MATKKTASKQAQKTNEGTKTTKASSETKKSEISAAAKPKKAKSAPAKTPAKSETPEWLKPSPTDYAAGTEDYRRLVEEHNKLFNTHFNPWRVRPQVFWGIHETVSNHYAKK